MKPPSLILWQRKIGESRNSNPYGRCEGKKRRGGRGRGEKKNTCPITLFFCETPYAGKRSSWLVRLGGVDWCLSINCKFILFIPFSSARNYGKHLFWIQKMADRNSNFNSALEGSLLELERLGMSRVLRTEQVKAISTLTSGEDLLAVLPTGFGKSLFSLLSPRPLPRSPWLAPFPPLFGSFNMALSQWKPFARARRKRLHCRLGLRRIASLTLQEYQCGSRSINLTSSQSG